VIRDAIKRDGFGKLLIHQSDDTGSKESTTIAELEKAFLG
jgi:hypothetical protein